MRVYARAREYVCVWTRVCACMRHTCEGQRTVLSVVSHIFFCLRESFLVVGHYTTHARLAGL